MDRRIRFQPSYRVQETIACGSKVPPSRVYWGSASVDDAISNFRLRTDNLTSELGDEIRVTLENTSYDELWTDTKGQYCLQLLTENGWETIFGYRDFVHPFTDLIWRHEPGKMSEWRLTLTEAGILEEYAHAADVTVCPDLQPGRDRFVFLHRPSLAVGFDVVS